MASVLMPAMPTTNWAIIVGGILASAVFPLGFLVQDKPPTPPTWSGSKKSPSMVQLFKGWFGKVPLDDPSYMDFHDRVDFTIAFIAFGLMASATTSWSNFSNQTYSPHGYSATQSGLLDATLLGAGIIAAITTAPLFDRFLFRWLSILIRVLLPIIAACWVSFIWLVKPNNLPVLFPIYAIIGVCSFTLLPVVLELGAEVTVRTLSCSPYLPLELTNHSCSGTQSRVVLFSGSGKQASCFCRKEF